MEKIVIGTDVVVDGQWMQIEEIFDEKTGKDCDIENPNVSMFAIDQNGESHEIGLDSIDHVY